jgi:hypothetical protein
VKAILAAVTVGLVALGPAAQAIPRPVNEGGDTRHCVTYAESQAVYLGTPRHRAELIMDTRGHRVPADLIDELLAPVTPGARPPRRMVRAYPFCADSGAVSRWFYVEYGTSHARQPVTAAAFLG